MCACEPTFVCSRCAGHTRDDWRVLDDGDEPSVREREIAEADRLWREQQGYLPFGRAW